MKSIFPKLVFIKKSDIYNGHTCQPEGTFSKNMYVTVNPWFEEFRTWESAYYHIGYVEELKQRISSLEGRLSEEEEGEE